MIPGVWTNKNPLNASHNLHASAQALKELYKGGTPAWIAHPEDFKDYANEDYYAQKEISDHNAKPYKLQDQELFTDYAPRLVHPMHVRTFVEKLRANGVQCFMYQEPPQPGIPVWLANTCALHAVVPSRSRLGHQKICNLRIPKMYEWSTLLTDSHDLQKAHLIGWRTALCQLIVRRVLTETEAHRIFGEPLGITSERYKNTLYQFRNGRLKENDRAIESI